MILMCETLGALCSQFYDREASDPNGMDVDQSSHLATTPNAIQQLLPRLLQKLVSIVGNNLVKEQVQLVEILSAVCLQSLLGHFMPPHVLDVFEMLLNATNYWTQYRIARSASRYGQHFLAAKIYDSLGTIISLEKLHFFLNGLSLISKAECILGCGREYSQIDLEYETGRDDETLQEGQPEPLGLSERLERSVSLYLKALTMFKVNLKRYAFFKL